MAIDGAGPGAIMNFLQKVLSLAASCILAVWGVALADIVSFTKGSDGSAAHQFRNPCKVSITLNPGFVANGTPYLQTETQSYAIPVTAMPAAGWRAVLASYQTSSGQNVQIPFTSIPGVKQFSIRLDSRLGGINIVTVRFATLRRTPAGLPDYSEDITVFGVGVPDLETFDLDGDGLPDIWERIYFGWDRTEANDDKDADGLSNIGEYRAGTSPLKKDNPLLKLHASCILR
jgi:hypothetical protein